MAVFATNVVANDIQQHCIQGVVEAYDATAVEGIWDGNIALGSQTTPCKQLFRKHPYIFETRAHIPLRLGSLHKDRLFGEQLSLRKTNMEPEGTAFQEDNVLHRGPLFRFHD